MSPAEDSGRDEAAASAPRRSRRRGRRGPGVRVRAGVQPAAAGQAAARAAGCVTSAVARTAALLICSYETFLRRVRTMDQTPAPVPPTNNRHILHLD